MQLREQLNNETQDKTELEIFLKRCIGDVREEISRRRMEITEKSGIHIPVSNQSSENRKPI